MTSPSTQGFAISDVAVGKTCTIDNDKSQTAMCCIIVTTDLLTLIPSLRDATKMSVSPMEDERKM